MKQNINRKECIWYQLKMIKKLFFIAEQEMRFKLKQTNDQKKIKREKSDEKKKKNDLSGKVFPFAKKADLLKSAQAIHNKLVKDPMCRKKL